MQIILMDNKSILTVSEPLSITECKNARYQVRYQVLIPITSLLSLVSYPITLKKLTKQKIIRYMLIVISKL